MDEKQETKKERKKRPEPTVVDKDKRSVAIVFINPQQPEQFFFVKRPDDPTDVFCNCWGLAAATRRDDETVEAAIQRIGVDKLGLQLMPKELLRSGQADRVTHKLDMEVWLVEAKGQLKMKQSGSPDVTYYAGWKWGTAADLEAPEALGSLCSKLFREWASEALPVIEKTHQPVGDAKT